MSRESATRLPPNSLMAPKKLSSFGSRKVNKSATGFDYLSSLPVTMLITILSLLPIKEVVCTSVLSSNWHELWKSVPLRLDDSSLHLENPAPLKRQSSNYSRGEGDWLHATISTILSFHKGPIEYCHLSCFDHHPNLFSTLRGYLWRLSEKNIKHLSIPFKKSWWNIYFQYEANSKQHGGYRLAKKAYQLPQSFLQCMTLTKLELFCCSVPENISMSIFPNLKEISLRFTFINDAFMECLFSSYSKLEKMHMQCCCGPKRIKISSEKLSELVITYGIDFPYVNLEEFYIDDAPNLEVLIVDNTPTNLVTRKMKMKIQLSSKVKMRMNCSLDDYRFIDV